MRMEEVELPGVGRKFTLRTQADDEIVVVVHHGGRRQMLFYEGGMSDEPTAALDLTDAEARDLGAILSGVLFHPERTGSATAAIDDQAIEWIVVPSGGPPVGKPIGNLAGVENALIIALIRHGALLPNPQPELHIEAGDTLVLAGTRGSVDVLKRQVSG